VKEIKLSVTKNRFLLNEIHSLSDTPRDHCREPVIEFALTCLEGRLIYHVSCRLSSVSLFLGQVEVHCHIFVGGGCEHTG